MLLIQDLFPEGPEEYVVDAAASLSWGLKKLQQEEYDVCLCDLSLPDSPREATIESLQAVETATPIVVLTSLNDIEIDRQLIQAGIQDYLPKDELSEVMLLRVCMHAIERKRLQQQVEVMARTDGLTGLFNRREFNRQMEKHLSAANRNGFPLSLTVMDVDYFKEINDQYGHDVGDMALKNIGNLLRLTTRDIDVAARFGGDEFVLLLPYVDLAGTTYCLERVTEQLQAQPLVVNGENVELTLSIGVGMHHTGMNSKELFNKADRALYTSKNSGRNQISVEI